MYEKPATRQILVNNPFCALYAVYGCRSRSASRATNHGLGRGAFCNMKLWRANTRLPSQGTPAELQRALVAEPYWAFRFYQVTKDPGVGQALIRYCEEHQRTNAGAAFVWLATNEAIDAGPFSELLHTSPMYAYTRCRMARHQRIQSRTGKKLGPLSPRWACHFALQERNRPLP